MGTNDNSAAFSRAHLAWFLPTSLVVNFLPLYWVADKSWAAEWVVIYYLGEILILIGAGYFKIPLGGLAREGRQSYGLIPRLKTTAFYTVYWIFSLAMSGGGAVALLEFDLSTRPPGEMAYLLAMCGIHRLGALVTNRAYLHQNYTEKSTAPVATMLPLLWGVLSLVLYFPVRGVLLGLEWTGIVALDASVQSALALGVAGGLVMVAYDWLIELSEANTDM